MTEVFTLNIFGPLKGNAQTTERCTATYTVKKTEKEWKNIPKHPQITLSLHMLPSTSVNWKHLWEKSTSSKQLSETAINDKRVEMCFLLPVMFHVVITMALDGMMTIAKNPINTSQWASTGSKIRAILISEIQKKKI